MPIGKPTLPRLPLMKKRRQAQYAGTLPTAAPVCVPAHQVKPLAQRKVESPTGFATLGR